MNPDCEICNIEMEEFDRYSVRGRTFIVYRCPDCGWRYDEGPDPDSLKGGPDHY